jgi:hypothetical protein
MFQKAYNIALCNKCGINERAGGLFEEGIIQTIISNLIILVNNTFLKMQYIFIQCVHCSKISCSFYQNVF